MGHRFESSLMGCYLTASEFFYASQDLSLRNSDVRSQHDHTHKIVLRNPRSKLAHIIILKMTLSSFHCVLNESFISFKISLRSTL